MSVVNISADPRSYPPGPCRVSLAFVDNAGVVLREARVTLRPGQATSLDYGFQPPPDPDRGDAVGATADRIGRQDLRARIEIVDLVDPGDRQPRLYPPGPCVPSVEVFETATGRTAFLVAEARMGAEPHLIPAPERRQRAALNAPSGRTSRRWTGAAPRAAPVIR